MSDTKLGDIILTKATGAGNSIDVHVDENPVRISIYPKANFGSDTGNLTMKNPDGTYDDVYDDAGQVILSASRPQVVLYARAIYRVEFSARASAIGAVAEDAKGAS